MATRKKGAARSRASGTPPASSSSKAAAVSKPLVRIVGVGASAGGIEAFTELLEALPDDPGLAFVLVQHQQRAHISLLSEVLARATSMPVAQVDSPVHVEPNHVYVAPPDGQLVIENGRLRTVMRPEGAWSPIDGFFQSLAADQRSLAIAVVLSGMQSDGTSGAQAIKAEGGITFAQDESARFHGMPESVVSSGVIDFVLSPSEISGELVRIREEWKHEDAAEILPQSELAKVFTILQKQFDVDFTHYKPTTIERRIRRRMLIHKTQSIAAYLRILRADPREVDHLYGELLIHVTGFFRDPEVFEALKLQFAPEMVRHRDVTSPLRVWVPGCATGEEVYSVAITVLETAAEAGINCPMQVFGTDISESAIERARAGIYPAEIEANVSPERLERFFASTNGSYQVNKTVRDCCIFARQNVTRDPPFSRLDLISCRNVMIYLGGVLQQKVMGIFHYALRPGGFLLLGSAETIGSNGELFASADRHHRIYQKKDGAPTQRVSFEAPVIREPQAQTRNRMDNDTSAPSMLFREADRVLLGRYAPAGVLINDNLEILQFRGRTSSFLEPAPGAATFNLLKMLREGLLAEVRSAVLESRKSGGPARRDGATFLKDGETATANIEVLPFVAAGNERHFVISFEEVAGSEEGKGKRRKGAAAGKEPRQLVRLRRELSATREYLQSVIEEQEAMSEEFHSANEVIQSSNEELQSINEELETAKEELQSTNEELTTLNEELENRNAELGVANNDLVNLLSSVEIPIVMVDSHHKIRRFNASAQRMFNLISGDTGRPINDLKSKLMVANLEQLISEVIETLEMREVKVQGAGDGEHLLRIRPYKTLDNKIQGAVLALVEGSGE